MIHTITSLDSGKKYTIDDELKTCSCIHFQTRMKKVGGFCKHLRLFFEKQAPPLYFEKEYRDFILKSPNSVEFIEKFGDATLEHLKRNGDVLEYAGKLTWIK